MNNFAFSSVIFLAALLVTPSFSATFSKTKLIGLWECIESGESTHYGFTLPASIRFTRNGKYSESFYYHGAEWTQSGKYRLLLSGRAPAIELSVDEAGGEGYAEYIRSINHANASGLDPYHNTPVFPFARLGWTNTGPVGIQGGKLLLNTYMLGYDHIPETLAGARIYAKTEGRP